MATDKAKSLKKELMNTPEEDFETLTFSELEEGQRFICLPSPGDNKGHGGFRKAHRLFKKTNEDRAKNEKTGFENMLPGSLGVILIEWKPSGFDKNLASAYYRRFFL